MIGHPSNHPVEKSYTHLGPFFPLPICLSFILFIKNRRHRI
jgi:hypothetical protein